jgi:hypothetical protein
MNATFLPRLPYPNFPLRPHKNGQWYKSVWNSRTKRSEQFYFGSWHDDPKGERAMKDPALGWLVRKDGIRAGVDNVRVERVAGVLTLGELMARFLAHKQGMTKAGELSKTTLAGYLREVRWFVEFMKPATPVSGYPKSCSSIQALAFALAGMAASARALARGEALAGGHRVTHALGMTPLGGVTSQVASRGVSLELHWPQEWRIASTAPPTITPASISCIVRPRAKARRQEREDSRADRNGSARITR